MSNKFTARNNAPWRADIVGSFLRPETLKTARAKFNEGTISAAELKAVEDAEIKTLIEKQKAAGLHVITDGEFRRAYWHLDFMWGFDGVEHIELEHGYLFHGLETAKGSIRLNGKITGEGHPFVEHFKYVKPFEEEGIVARQTIPAPQQSCAGRPPRECYHHHPCLYLYGIYAIAIKEIQHYKVTIIFANHRIYRQL